MNTQRFARTALAAALIAAAPAWAQLPEGDLARLSSQYTSWAGSKANADAIVAGLTRGSSITLVTSGPNGSASLAGFTPAGAMNYADARSALASAQQSLSRLGITRPTAEQIQAALIGGDVVVPGGATRQVAGSIGVRGVSPVASR
jgi:hypothetical protein